MLSLLKNKWAQVDFEAGFDSSEQHIQSGPQCWNRAATQKLNYMGANIVTTWMVALEKN